MGECAVLIGKSAGRRGANAPALEWTLRKAAPPPGKIGSIGFELLPQIQFLRGLDLQATWYSIKINSVLTDNLNQTSSSFGDPNQKYHFIVPSDLGCPVAANNGNFREFREMAPLLRPCFWRQCV